MHASMRASLQLIRTCESTFQSLVQDLHRGAARQTLHQGSSAPLAIEASAGLWSSSGPQK